MNLPHINHMHARIKWHVGDPKEFPRRKESWYLDMVPSGMLPVLILDDQIISESDVILQALEDKFGELNGQSFTSNKVSVCDSS